MSIEQKNGKCLLHWNHSAGEFRLLWKVLMKTEEKKFQIHRKINKLSDQFNDFFVILRDKTTHYT